MKNILLLTITSIFLFGCATAVPNAKTNPVTSELAAEAPIATASTEVAKADSQEWKGLCRKITNEAGVQIKSKPYQRLQNSYLFDGKQLVWMVKNYQDANCQNFTGGHRYVFQCNTDPFVKSAQCTQKTIESWSGQKWKSKKMVDSAGFKDQLIMQYFLNPTTDGKVILKSRSISDDGEETTEKLCLSNC